MGDSVRQGIHFDLDTKALGKYYPKPAWRTAYDDIKSFMENNGFEHEQGSGYHSKEMMDQDTAVRLLRKMRRIYPWLNKCVNACTVADVPASFDFVGLFNRDAKIPDRTELAAERHKQER